MPTLFISDLHLSEKTPALSHHFVKLLSEQASHCEAVYILGDLFEVWLGDDGMTAQHQAILAAIHQLTNRGITVYFMHGNRDFLIGERFATLTGCQLLAETLVIDLYGVATLLMHGDQLCTDDLDYQAFRQQVRHPLWQEQFLKKPIEERIRLAQTARAESHKETSQKSDDIMDANQDAIINAFKTHRVNQLIHGHTHRPNVHYYDINGTKAMRIVLGDWCHQTSTLLVEPHHFSLSDERVQINSASLMEQSST